MTATITKSDGSYVIILPAGIADFINMKESETVNIFEEHGRIVIQKPAAATLANNPVRKTIDELFEGYNGDYKPVEIDWGKPVGNEIW